MTQLAHNPVPGLIAERSATPRRILVGGLPTLLPVSKVIDGSKARDPLNTGDLDVLRNGLLLGKITSGGKYAPSILGVLAAAYDASADTTEMTVSAATAVELVRRIGSSGTFKLTGPPAASGTVQTVTVTYSAVDTTTGVITVTALDVDIDEVHTITFDAAMTGGVLDVTYFDSDGEPIHVTTPWDADWATTMAAWNVASTAAATAHFGEASDGAVMTGTATVPVLTYSGVGVAALSPGQLAEADVSATTGPEYATVVQTTAAAEASGAGSNDFIVGSFVQPTDGSETPKGIVYTEDGTGIKVTDQDASSVDVQLAHLLVGGMIDSSQIINWPSDTSLIAWLVSQLNAAGVGQFQFDHLF